MTTCQQKRLDRQEVSKSGFTLARAQTVRLDGLIGRLSWKREPTIFTLLTKEIRRELEP